MSWYPAPSTIAQSSFQSSLESSCSPSHHSATSGSDLISSMDKSKIFLTLLPDERAPVLAELAEHEPHHEAAAVAELVRVAVVVEEQGDGAVPALFISSEVICELL